MVWSFKIDYNEAKHIVKSAKECSDLISGKISLSECTFEGFEKFIRGENNYSRQVIYLRSINTKRAATPS